MAGDWIKVEKATSRKPEVLRLASILGIHPDHAFGLCVRFWCWCDDNLTVQAVSRNRNADSVTHVSRNRNADSVTTTVSAAQIDALLCHDGVSAAMSVVGWLEERNGEIYVPRADSHLTQSAKSRALTAKRVAKTRSRSRNAHSVTRALPEKRREEKSNNNPISLPFASEKFAASWAEWQAHRAEIRKPLKPTQARKQLATLATMGEERALRMIAHTIERGWVGLREPEPGGNGAVAPTQPATVPPEPPKYITPARMP